MQIYLPIAEMSVNVLVLIGIGGLVGFLSGVFGVGGGFLLTPFLIFIGVPPAVAVGTGANELVAASVSGMIAHWRRGNVDFQMGGVLLAGGMVGSLVGAWIFNLVYGLGQVDLLIGITYVVLLGGTGGLMFVESLKVILRTKEDAPPARKLHSHTWLHGLPFKMRFRRSKLYVSALLPLGIGFAIGILAAVMGVGGGFMLVPAMIYLLGMPTLLVVGTSLFQITFVTASATFFHALGNKTVDVVLALLLLVGAVVGAQIGARIGAQLKGEQLRVLLALIVLGVCLQLGYGLVATPGELFSMARAP
ncbi:MAG: sulfite exporter TauE/SafE family protein [Alphaproteobacteria bacterium]|nr:sulfite exporter TauE/SafE family protein [Alphaproteobacteria bacterium]